MKHSKFLASAAIAFASAVFTTLAPAATPAEEKAFVDTYRKALEAGDSKTLESFLLTKGAAPEAVELFKMMQTLDTGAKVVSVELAEFTPEEVTRNAESRPGPGGQMFKLPIKPYKKLVIKTETKDANGSSSGTSSVPIAEKDGKLIIPVPAPAK